MDTGPPETEHTATAQRTRTVLWAGLAYALARILVPYIPGLPVALANWVFTVAFVVLALFIAARIAWEHPRRLGGAAAAFGACCVLFFAISFGIAPLTGMHWAIIALADLTQMAAAIAGGILLSGVVREAKLLPALVVTVAVVDFVGVYYGGPVGQMLESNPEVVERFSQRIPEAGSKTRPTETGEGPEVTYVGTAGLGDILFVAFFFACVGRFGLNYGPTLRLTLVLGALAMLVVLATEWPVPALPFVAAGAFLVNTEHFRYTRQEKTALLVAGVFLIAFCLAMVLGSRAMVGP